MAEADESSTHGLKPEFVVAVASSAGGLTALSTLVSGLSASFPASIVIVQHVSPTHTSFLSHILTSRTVLKVKQAEENDRLSSACIYVAPPNWHVLVKLNGTLTLSQAAPTHFVRPSADILFESVAKSFKERAIAIVLTGTGVDGADGVKIVKEMGGTVIAQDQATSEFFGMPEAAIRTGQVDHILPLHQIAPFLSDLVASRNTE